MSRWKAFQGTGVDVMHNPNGSAVSDKRAAEVFCQICLGLWSERPGGEPCYRAGNARYTKTGRFIVGFVEVDDAQSPHEQS